MPQRMCAFCHHWGTDGAVEIDNDHVLARCSNPFSIQRGAERRGRDACLAFISCRTLGLAHKAFDVLHPAGEKTEEL